MPSIFTNFGSEVTIVELAEKLIPPADIEVSKRLERSYKQKKLFDSTKSNVNKYEERLTKRGVII